MRQAFMTVLVLLALLALAMGALMLIAGSVGRGLITMAGALGPLYVLRDLTERVKASRHAP